MLSFIDGQDHCAESTAGGEKKEFRRKPFGSRGVGHS